MSYVKKYPTIFFTIALFVFEIIIFIFEPYISPYSEFIFMGVIAILIVLFLIHSIKVKKIDYKLLIYLFIIIGVLLRTNYIMSTTIYERQHDVETLDTDGQLKYIYILFTTGALPTNNIQQMYHPPLWHMIAAIWMKILSIFNLSISRLFESIQILTCILSSLIIVIGYKITKLCKIEEKNQMQIVAFLSVFPSFILLSGSINNDCLTIFFMLLIILYLIKYNEDGSWKNIISLALITGLCVTSKLNGAMMTIPILYVFIKKIIKYHKSRAKLNVLFQKIICFGLISLPIGLWYQVYSLLNYDYFGIPKPGEGLYIGNYSFFQRFFFVSFTNIFKKPFCVLYGENKDYNIYSYIIKNSIFGEYNLNNHNINIFLMILLILNFILITISLFAIIKYLYEKYKKKEKAKFILDLLFITWITFILFFFYFNYKYPYTCSMDFRYIMPTAFCGIVFLVLNNKYKNKKINKIISYLLYVYIFLCIIYGFTYLPILQL